MTIYAGWQIVSGPSAPDNLAALRQGVREPKSGHLLLIIALPYICVPIMH
jgi:hypothetical protein